MELMDVSLDKLYRIVHGVAKQPFNEDVLGSVGVTVLKALTCLKRLNRIIHRGERGRPARTRPVRREALEHPAERARQDQDLRLRHLRLPGGLDRAHARRGLQAVHGGKPGPMASPILQPERLISSVEGYDTRSDVWSLGITLVSSDDFGAVNFTRLTVTPLY